MHHNRFGCFRSAWQQRERRIGPGMPSRCQDFTIMNSSMNSLLSSELLLMKWKARTGRLGQNEFCCVTGKASVFQGTAWHLPSSSR